MESKNSDETIIEKGLFITAILSIFIILVILVFIISEAIPAFQEYGFFHFLSGMIWSPGDEQYGVLPMIVGSIYVTLLSFLQQVYLVFYAACVHETARAMPLSKKSPDEYFPSSIYSFESENAALPFRPA